MIENSLLGRCVNCGFWFPKVIDDVIGLCSYIKELHGPEGKISIFCFGMRNPRDRIDVFTTADFGCTCFQERG